MGIRPLLFVAMPFGKKPDSSGRYEIDFDDIYERAIRPAAEGAGVDIVRADEEAYGGLIHVPMYERLLLAEIVLADLTLANPNVFYELGVRHAARPRSTILMFAKESALPFDLKPMRAIPYDLTDGKLSDDKLPSLLNTLQEKIESAKSNTEYTDSPLFQLLPGITPLALPHEVTESFRDRVGTISMTRQRIREASQEKGGGRALESLSRIEAELLPFAERPPELLLDLMLAYRAASAWDAMVKCIEKFPDSIRRVVTVQEQLAMALNRRHASGDRQRALDILDKLTEEYAPSPETYGILGRIYKDMYTEYLEAGREAEAAAALEQAIDSYENGFRADPRDYYPGINAISLSLSQGGEEAQRRVEELRPVVAFAVSRRGGLNSSDYWDVATVLELAVIGRDWKTAERAAARCSMLAKEGWTPETTVNNLLIIRRTLQESDDQTRLDKIVELLRRRAEEIKGDDKQAE